MSMLAPTLQAFFTDRLIRQRQASPHTIAAYRDAFKLLLGFVAQHVGKPPATLDVADLDAETIAAFLDHLERDRGNSVSTVTHGSPQSGRCSGSPHCAIPSTPRSSHGSWPSRPNGSTEP
jgi:site-specific recombinase XerC